ncbi:MAG: hypothetical protein ACKOI3_01335 [Actinomycetota bacterium]
MPAVVDSVVQSRSSEPVTVNVIVVDVDDALVAAKVTVGAMVSMTIALFEPSEFAAPGDGSVSVALLFPASLIVPPPADKAPVVV